MSRREADNNGWRRNKEERDRSFERRSEALYKQLRDLAERRERNADSAERGSEQRAIERAIELLDAAQDWASNRYADPSLSFPNIGDLPPRGTEFLNRIAHSIAWSMSEADDGKAYRRLLGEIVFNIQIAKEHLVYRLSLLERRVRVAGIAVRLFQGVLLAAILWRVW